jgi:hypothetical protein
MRRFRRNRILSSGLGLLALAELSGCCASPACGQQAFFEIHLVATRAQLDGGELTICRNGFCSAGKPVWAAPQDGWERADFVLAGDLSTTSANVSVSPDGRAWIQVATQLERSGDRFDLRLVDVQGATLLDFSRSLRYDQREACGQECLTGSIRVWPDSPSGLTCSARTCGSGVAITADVTLPDGRSGDISIEICRNDLCGSVLWPSLSRAGSLGAGVSERSLGANRMEFRITTNDDPADLADGDRYRVTIMDDQQNVLAAIDRTVTYDATYPNGSECDPYPCRWVEIAP